MRRFLNIIKSKSISSVKFFLFAFFCALVVMFQTACKKDEPHNPYLDIVQPQPQQNPDADDLPVGSFAWLHAKVFAPTCANSGCHDGTFEPEFRTMASAYNSLVNHPVIANDPTNSFEYRVVPGDAESSFLHERLYTFVPNTSGIMPLETNGTDWPENGILYKQKITEWINAGAPDIYGNPAPSSEVNAPPLIYGFGVFPQNNTTQPYLREVDSPYGIGAIEVPAAPVDVWILPYDDNAGFNLFNSITLKTSTSATNFSSQASVPFVLSGPISALDFGNNINPFYYKATLDLSSYAPGTYYLRLYLNDGVQPSLTEVPNNNSNAFWYLIYSIKVQ